MAQYEANEPNKITTTPATGEVRENGAEIYAEPKKRGFPWWVLLLGLIPLLLLWNRNNTEPTPAATPVAMASASSEGMSSTDSAALPPAERDREVYSGTDITVAPPGGASMDGVPLTDVVTFSRVADKSTLIGKMVKLTDVDVVEVLSPRAMIVGPATGEHMLVLLDERLDIGTAPQAVPVTEGAKLSLTGMIKELPAPDALTGVYGVASDKMMTHTDDTVYLHATILQNK